MDFPMNDLTKVRDASWAEANALIIKNLAAAGFTFSAGEQAAFAETFKAGFDAAIEHTRELVRIAEHDATRMREIANTAKEYAKAEQKQAAEKLVAALRNIKIGISNDYTDTPYTYGDYCYETARAALAEYAEAIK